MEHRQTTKLTNRGTGRAWARWQPARAWLIQKLDVPLSSFCPRCVRRGSCTYWRVDGHVGQSCALGRRFG